MLAPDPRPLDELDRTLTARLVEFDRLPADERARIDAERWLPTRETYRLYLKARNRRISSLVPRPPQHPSPSQQRYSITPKTPHDQAR